MEVLSGLRPLVASMLMMSRYSAWILCRVQTSCVLSPHHSVGTLEFLWIPRTEWTDSKAVMLWDRQGLALKCLTRLPLSSFSHDLETPLWVQSAESASSSGDSESEAEDEPFVAPRGVTLIGDDEEVVHVAMQKRVRAPRYCHLLIALYYYPNSCGESLNKWQRILLKSGFSGQGQLLLFCKVDTKPCFRGTNKCSSMPSTAWKVRVVYLQ